MRLCLKVGANADYLGVNTSSDAAKYVSRGGDKLAAALDAFGLHVGGLVCADLGSHVGGFVDCLIQRGASKVYSVDTSYGTLAWKLRKDCRVVVRERTNAMHVSLPELVDLVTIDVGWTPQKKIMPNAGCMVKPGGAIISLVKPHYESDPSALLDGVLPDDRCAAVLDLVLTDIRLPDFELRATTASPIRGHGGNQEFFAHLIRIY
jgi:23S rRNA (cytidine1920-2'-O)/16S rRNA (cytidine1409-2'-O)-methyltransferase